MHTETLHPAPTPRTTTRIVKRYGFTVEADIGRVFPLLCPVREYDWIDGWSAELVYTDSGVAEPGCVFRTDHTGRGPATWIITRHEPDAGVIEFAIVAGALAETLAIRATPDGDGRTRLRWTRTFTSLDENGEGPVTARRVAERCDEHMAWAERSLVHYLRAGEMLRHGAPS